MLSDKLRHSYLWGEKKDSSKMIFPYEVTLELLRSEAEENQSQRVNCKINFLGDSFIVNPHKNHDNFNRLIFLAKEENLKKVISFIKSIIGFFPRFKTKHKILNKMRIMTRIFELKLKIRRWKEEISIEKKIAKLKLKEGKSLLTVSQNLNLSKSYVQQVLRKIRYSKRAISEILNPLELKRLKIFIRNVPKLLSLYRSRSFCILSLKDQFKKFRKLKEENEIISFKLFVNLVKKYMNLRKVSLNRIGISKDQMNLRQSRRVISCTLIHLMIQKINLVFFDVCAINQRDYKKWIWTINDSKKSNVRMSKFCKQAKILMCCDHEKILSYVIVAKADKKHISWFLYESIKHFRKNLKMSRLVFFADNAKPHHSVLVKGIFSYQQVYLIYNAPTSAKINHIEYVFELIKRPLRMEMTKPSNSNVLNVAAELVSRVEELDLSPQTHRWLIEVSKAITLARMW